MLSLVERERPGESRLLTTATHPHGNVKSAIFTSRETNQYRQLVAWVYQVAGVPMPDAVAAAAELSGNTVRRAARRQSQHKTPRNTGETAGAKPAPPSTRPAGSPPAQEADTAATATGAADAVDPFDPAVFNRRYHAADDED